jgi:hypothetical protein
MIYDTNTVSAADNGTFAVALNRVIHNYQEQGLEVEAQYQPVPRPGRPAALCARDREKGRRMTPPVIDPENTWVVSDTHFGHQNIVGFCHRPLDHEQAMIAEWRAHVPEDATVVHLGDLCYKGNAFFKNIVAPGTHRQPQAAREGQPRQGPLLLLPRLRLQDRRARSASSYEPAPRADFDVVHGHLLALPAQGAPAERMHLHGHIHNNGYAGKDEPYTPFSAGQINLSVEQTKYRPVNLKSLLDGYIQGCYEQAQGAKREALGPCTLQLVERPERTGCLAVATGGLGVRRRRRPAHRCPADGRVDRAWRAGLARTA